MFSAALEMVLNVALREALTRRHGHLTLEHLLYGCLLETARYDAADEAFAKLKELYFDWNEIRVTTVTEVGVASWSCAYLKKLSTLNPQYPVVVVITSISAILS